MKTGLFTGVAVCLLACPGSAQKLKRADRELATELSQDWTHLGPDTPVGGKAPAAVVYMSDQLARAGVSGGGENGGFTQVEHVDEGKVIGSRCALTLDGKTAVPGIDFFPLVGCPDAHAAGSTGVSLHERGLPWIYDLRYDLEAGKLDMVAKALEAKKKGATALLLYNSSGIPDGLKFDGSDKKTIYALPVVYISKELSAKAFKDQTAYVDVELTVATQERKYDLYNLAGYVDNGAARTVILESAYDTTSGAAALLALTRLVKHAGWKKHNYLVIAYPGGRGQQALEAYFARHPDVQRDKVDFVIDVEGMANPDPSVPELTVRAWRPRQEWKSLFGKRDAYLKVRYEEFPADTLDIPGGFLAFSTSRNGAGSYDGEALAVRYVFNGLTPMEKK